MAEDLKDEPDTFWYVEYQVDHKPGIWSSFQEALLSFLISALLSFGLGCIMILAVLFLWRLFF